MERYAETKLLLFQRKELESIIINVTDSVGRAFASQDFSAKLWTYGQDDSAGRLSGQSRCGSGSITLCLHSPVGEIAFTSELRGHFNVANLSAVATTLVAHDYSASCISEVMGPVAACARTYAVLPRVRCGPTDGRGRLCAHPEALSTLLESFGVTPDGSVVRIRLRG